MYIEKTVEAAEVKYALYSRSRRLFLLKSLLGGAFIVFGTITAYSTANALYPTNQGYATLGMSLAFTLALISIIFLNGELFTSGVFVMTVGFLDKKITLTKVLKLWALCYIGNFIAVAVFASLYCLTKSYPPGLEAYVTLTVAKRLNYSIPQLLFKGMFCNFAVCCAYYATVRVSSESAKFMLIFICIYAFVVSGYEHSVANMAFFSIAYYIMDGFSVALALKNLLFCTIGNIIGGALMLGLPVYLLERKYI